MKSRSTVRLALYIAANATAAASSGLSSLDFKDPKQVLGYLLGILGVSIVTARSYLDQSHSKT